MEKSKSDSEISIGDDKKSDKIASGVIECSLNMNVSLSRANKRSKYFQRAQSLLIVIATILFAIACTHLKKEVQALELQINNVNTNLMTLMLRYEKLNKNLNRIRYHRLSNHHRFVPESIVAARQSNPIASRNVYSPKDEDSKVEDLKKASQDQWLLLKNLPVENSTYENKRSLEMNSREEEEEEEAAESRDDNSNDERISKDNNSNDFDRERYERAIVAFEKRNKEIKTASIDLSDSREDLIEDTKNTWNETRTGRYRRDEGRGKKRRKIKRRLKRSRRRLGPLIATFVGAIPEQHVTDTVYIGPWVKSTRNESRYAFNKFHLVEDKTSIEVTTNGLYMISAQIYYYGEPAHFSYWILLSSEGVSNTRKVIKCATVSAVSASEASCYTSVVLPLRRGDRLHIQQQERDRLINLREGHSYVQIMLLSSESSRRRGS